MTTRPGLVSVVIPAFNNPEYTRKTIHSVMLQTYRPIEIILSDDDSPQSLKPLADEKMAECGPGLEIKYFRQKENLNYYWNLLFGIKEASGQYLILLDHDDWLIDPDFFSDAIKAIQGQPDCCLSIANTFIEGSPQTIFNLYYERWHYVDGPALIKNCLFSTIHPSRSAVMLRFDKLRELGYEQFFVEAHSAKKMNIMPDEAFVLICLLASGGTVALTGRVVSVRGMPTGSLSRTAAWHHSGGQKMFVPHFLLYRYFKAIGCADGVQAMSHNMLLRYPCHTFNTEMVRYVGSDRLAIAFMALGVLLFHFRRVMVVPRRILASLRSLVIRVAKKIFL